MALRIFTTKPLTASKEGIVTGPLLTFGEPGMTSKGKVIVDPGVLEVPDTVALNREHKPTDPIGKLKLKETSKAILAAPMLAQTAAGKDAAVEIAEGLRASLSVEIENPIIRSGRLVSGTLTGAALVARPAFPSSVLNASAPDEGDLEEAGANVDDALFILDDVIEALEEAAAAIDGETPSDTDETNETKEPAMTAARVRTGSPLLKATETKHDKNWLIANLVKQAQTRDSKLLAALADVVPADILGIEQPQYVGELWNGVAYQRRFITMFNHADLTAFEVQGWQWVTRPEVARWAGNKTAVPSNKIETAPVKIDAERIAGAHDIDRKFRDFGNQEFWNAYFAAMSESYAKQSDWLALAEVKEAAPVVKAKPTTNSIAQGLVNIVDGSIAILNETETMPTSAVVALDLWRDILLTPKNDVLGYLEAAFGLDNGEVGHFQISPSATFAPGETLVSTRSAATVHELGGGTPIRVEALDVAKGGIDSGVFGYIAVNIHDKGGLCLVNNTGEAGQG